MTRHSPQQQLKEAHQIARDHGLLLIECPAKAGKTDYVVYRRLPSGDKLRLGKRGSVPGVRKYVADLTGFH